MDDETFVDPYLDGEEIDPSIELDEPDGSLRLPRYCRPGYRAFEARLWRVLLMVATFGVTAGLFLIAARGSALGVAVAVASIVPIAALGWRRAQFEFCPRCEARTRCFGLRWSWCPGCGRVNDPAALFPDGPRQLDLDNDDYVSHDDPIVKMLCLILLLATKDKATEVTFRPGPNCTQCFLALPEGVFELVPPPAHVYPYLASVVRCLIAETDAAEIQMLRGEFTLRFENVDHVAQAEVQTALGHENFSIRWAA